MSDSTIRWLHLSDFHVGKDNYGQLRMFKYILDHIQQRVKNDVGPHMVFITGDLANKGQNAEYEDFVDNFIYPLSSILEDTLLETIFTIPGNHDVDRSKAKAVQRYNVLWSVPEFLDPTDQGLAERRSLLPRFDAFSNTDLSTRSGWLHSAAGSFATTRDLFGFKLGILGVNTAWLSGGEEDRNKLSPGKGIIETGLEMIRDCDVRIVLGHHPLDWFTDEDAEAIRALFGRNNVIYLHGHLHKSRSRQEEGTGYPFLTIQSGASFQAREDEQWTNRILWCELDLPEKKVDIEPLRWSRDNQEWALDGSAFPNRYRKSGTDRWTLPLPSSEVITRSESSQKVQVPNGWLSLDQNYLSNYQGKLSSEQTLRFFDGRVPGWEEALSPNIPRREVVNELQRLTDESRQNNEIKTILLTGAGGEGKSTILRQFLCELAKSDHQYNIIWHDDTDTPLPLGYLLRLPKSETTWIIASDDADLIASDVFGAVKALRGANRKNFQFLLCCRDTDWLGAKGDLFPWRQFSSFSEVRIRGLSLTDAELIVDAWGAYGSQGLGALASSTCDLEEGARKLAEAAKSETYDQEGAFLGAMLRVRIGDGLKDNIKALLVRLQQRSAPGGTLLDAFAYIAAFHAENKLILSKEVLAKVLRCRVGDIKRKITGPLGEEAAATTSGQFIFTRHKAIAEAAVEVLSRDFHIDFEELYIELLRIAIQLASSGTFVPHLSTWRFLSTHFFEKGDFSFAIRLAHESLKLEPHNVYLVVHLSKLLRELGEADQSVRLFYNRVVDNQDRAYYFEWGTAEGSIGNHGLGTLLAGIALADIPGMNDSSRQNAVICLSGLSVSFGYLFEKYNQSVFEQASRACAQLALDVDPGTALFLPKALIGVQRVLIQAQEQGENRLDKTALLEQVKEGLVRAWDYREREIPKVIQIDPNFKLSGLSRLIGLTVQ